MAAEESCAAKEAIFEGIFKKLMVGTTAYVPRPLDTSGIELSDDLVRLGNSMAEHCHDVWAIERTEEGWVWGPHLDDVKKTHPNLIPFKELPVAEQKFDFQTSQEVIKVVLSMDYSIARVPSTPEAVYSPLFVPSTHKIPYSTSGQVYTPRPLNTTKVHLPEDLVLLRDLLAENTHEVWSKGRIDAGWTHGPQRNDQIKTHNCLVPYADLSESEKSYDVKLAQGVLKMLIACGYSIVKPQRNA
ncbi:Aste57867_1559 [Aphanomyces stellatus]|uniref:Aste57867_1559 protein n=1 Tax=Aphanomyces stellatus TaxID=120398 RepID=A0A485K6R2_9STRA|nr:hypothetical protein As57867_001558 [Aphanomyces stellatus]VFT78773.1 Aste57867_1559 [Aphanomyces stellatus]